MTLLTLVLTIAIAGFLVWLVMLLPLPQPFPKIIVGVVCLLLVIFILQQLGVHTGLPVIRLW